MQPRTVKDVLIIGGGPAGLQTALGLARQLHTAIVFDSGVYRNDNAHHMHNALTWDHTNPKDFRARARENILERYKTIEFKQTVIESVSKTDDGLFEAKDMTGATWTGRKLALATGSADIMLDIPGYQEGWGTGIFHCLFCHGFEDRGCASAGILAIGDVGAVGPAMHLSRMARRMTGKVTIYTDGNEDLTKQLGEPAEAAGFTVDSRRITKLKKEPKDSKMTLDFDSGDSIVEGFLVHKPKNEVIGPFAEQLALELTPQGDIKTTPPFFETSMHGVFALGDCGTPGKAAAAAMNTGLYGASGIVMQLQGEGLSPLVEYPGQDTPKTEGGANGAPNGQTNGSANGEAKSEENGH